MTPLPYRQFPKNHPLFLTPNKETNISRGVPEQRINLGRAYRGRGVPRFVRLAGRPQVTFKSVCRSTLPRQWSDCPVNREQVDRERLTAKSIGRPRDPKRERRIVNVDRARCMAWYRSHRKTTETRRFETENFSVAGVLVGTKWHDVGELL